MRFLLRMIGFWLIAGAVVAAVHDGARSIGANTLEMTSLGAFWFAVDPESLNLTQAVIQRYVLPFLWDPVLVNLLTVPLWLALVVLGIGFAVAGRRKPRPIIEQLDPR